MRLLLENVWPDDRVQIRGFTKPDWVIYGLADPRDGNVRYVGYTHNPNQRLQGHIKHTSKQDTHPGRWLKNLKLQGLRPAMCILEYIYGGIAARDAAEIKWINGPWRSGLTNHALGGRGADLNGPNGQASREKMSASARSEQRLAQLRRMQNDPAIQARRREGVARAQQSPEWREKMRKILANSNAKPENQAKLKERGRSEENLARLKRMAVKCGKWQPEDTLHIIAHRQFGSQMRAHIFGLIRDGMTVEELIDVCAPFGYDTRHYLGKFINVYCVVEVRKAQAADLKIGEPGARVELATS